MLKKQKYAILSFIIIVGIFLFGIKLPDFANAAGTDRKDLIKKLVKISVLQDGEVIPQSGINLNKSIDVKLEFKLPVKGDVPAPAEYVNKGDSAVISLGTGVKLTPAGTTHITKEIKVNGTGLKIGEVTFKPKAAGSDEMVAEFQFNGDASVYDGSNRGVEVKAGVEFAIETKDIDPNNLTNKTITVLGKEYKIDPKLDDIVTIEKKHEIEPYYIKWTLVVSRSAIGINKKLDLAGLKIRDNLEGVTIQGSSAQIKSAIENDFYVNNVKRAPEYSIGRKELTYTFQAGDTDDNGCATVTFKTYMGDRYVKVYEEGGKLYKNTADVMDRAGKQRDSAEDSFKWPGFAEKAPKKQPGDKLYRQVGTDYYVDWNIDFNLNGDTLSGVKIKEPMPSDEFKNAELVFVSAAAVAWNGSDFDIAHPVKPFNVKASDDIYEIGNVTKKMRLMVTTKVKYNAGVTSGNYCKFQNSVKVIWDKYLEGVRLSGVVNVGVKPVKKGVVQITTDQNYQNILPFETEWNVYVEKNNDSNYYNGVYAYDLMIFDENENIPKLGDTDNPVTFKEENTDNVATPHITSLSQIKRYDRRQKYISGSFSNTSSPHLQHKVYRVFRGEKHVGDLLEVWGFKHDDTERNNFRLKTILQEPSELIKKTEKAQLFNGITLVKVDKQIDYEEAWPTFYTKILKKQAMSKDDAKALLTPSNNFSPSLANVNVFDTTAKKFIDNKDLAYNKEDHSILYRININGSSMYNIGDLELSDTAPKGWEFDNIEGNNKFLIYDGKSYTEAYLPDATVKAENKISAPNNDIEVDVTSGSAIFKFKDIKKPYVVFLKIKMKDTREYLNKKEVVENEATVKLGKNETTDRQLVTVDEQFLTKQVDDSNLLAGYVTWTINYKPYGFLTADSVILEDVLGEGLEIRRYSDNRGLLFENNNFKVKKGSTYLTGEDLKNFFRYDAGTRKLTFALDNRNEEYEISYITDIVDKNVKEKLHNTVTVLEGSNKIEMEPKEAVYTVANAYANATLKGFQRIKIVKTDKDGNTKLKGAEFSLLNKADRTVYTSATTDENGILYLRKLIDGEYILKETKAPEGYVADGKEYQVKIEEESVSNKVEMKVTLDGTVLANNEITIKNEKKPVTPVTPDGGGGGTPPTPPTDPSKPTEPSKPTDPSKPIEPSKPTDPLKPVTPNSEDNPEDPDDPDDPDTPTPTPSIPSYPLNRTPDPNDPNSPDEITVVSDDGTPLGKFVKKKKPNGEFEYVDADDGTPLASFKFPNDIPRNLPKTGGEDNAWYYLTGAGILLGAGFVFRKRKEIF